MQKKKPPLKMKPQRGLSDPAGACVSDGLLDPAETRCSAVALRDPVKADFERDGKGVVAEDWLHVVSDEAATELRFPEKPCDLPSLHIWRGQRQQHHLPRQ